MIRTIIKIDEELCNGCGLCAKACHEGAIAMEHGKARLIRDDYCDGLGNCLPACPTGAITFEQREAAPFDAQAVAARQKEDSMNLDHPLPCGCPGSQAREIVRSNVSACAASDSTDTGSRLHQWPVQIKLAPLAAPYFDGADLLIAADCAAYACGDFHTRFIKNRVVLIGCPKLDEGDYSQKLTEILLRNNIKSVTVVRMEVPCCGGIEQAVKTALQQSGKFLPWQVVTLSTDGQVLE